MTLLSTKPYLIRAIHEWCLDQGFTPYLQVAVDHRCRVPRDHVRDGQIVLNVGATATSQLLLGNDEIEFKARFSGQVFGISVPIDAVAAIYARENGQGMAFDVVPVEGAATATDDDKASAAKQAPGADTTETSETPPEPTKPAGGGRSHLTRIK
jgi:stringent starvation protein B